MTRAEKVERVGFYVNKDEQTELRDMKITTAKPSPAKHEAQISRASVPDSGAAVIGTVRTM